MIPSLPMHRSSPPVRPGPAGARLFSRWWMRAGLIFLLFTLVGLFEAGQSLMLQSVYGRSMAAWRSLLIGVLDWYIWAMLTPLVVFAVHTFPIEQRYWPGRLFLHVVLGFVLSVVVIVFFTPILSLVNSGQDGIIIRAPDSTAELAFQLIVLRFSFYILTYWVIVGVTHALGYYRKYREREMQTVLLESRLAQTQLQMLKMQLHPHFLFNTLNAISALMHQDVELADQMLARLAQLLRNTLESAGTQEVSLKQELEFVELYLEIEQARFGPRLQVRIDADAETMDASVPNLILQPLVENAIRHGIAPRPEPGHIEIRACRDNGTLQLQVLDDGPGFASDARVPAREGVGLGNTRARLQQLYGPAHQFTLANRSEGGVAVTLRLPFREHSDGFSALAGASGEPAVPVAN